MKAAQPRRPAVPGRIGRSLAARPGYPTVIVPFGLAPNAPTPAFPDGFDGEAHALRRELHRPGLQRAASSRSRLRVRAGLAEARRAIRSKTLERRQERQNLPLVAGAQAIERLTRARALVVVATDRVLEAKAREIVHEAGAQPQTPERRGPDLVPRRRPSVLHDSVTGAEVVQQEVAERMDDLVPERIRDLERAAVDESAGGRGGDGRGVAGAAADVIEDLAARAPVVTIRKVVVQGGALVDRMKSANSSTSTPSSSTPGTGSSTTPTPLNVSSTGCSGLVMPISFT